MSDQSKDKTMNRRRFIKTSTAAVVGGTALAGLAAAPLLRSETLLLRPPGALEENQFLASCIKCGQCLQVCPPQVIELAGIFRGFAVGTPYIIPREGGCILCAGLPCVLACPTGSLSHDLSEGKDAEMGLAVISSPKTCLSIKDQNDIPYRIRQLLTNPVDTDGNQTGLQELLTDLTQGLTEKEQTDFKKHFSLAAINENEIARLSFRLNKEDFSWLLSFSESAQFSNIGCRICFDKCPIKSQETIKFETKTNQTTGDTETWPIIQKTCVGCGVCEEKCPTPMPSITIIPRKKWEEASA